MKISKRFFGVLTCFFLLFFAPIKHDSLAACGADPNADSVKIAGHAYTSTSIQDAYNYASTTLSLPSFTLQLAGEIFTEDLLLNGGAVVLDGGWDCSFTTKTSPSRVFGTITIRNGSLNYAAGTEGPKVVSTDQCAFDNDVDGYSSIGSCTGSADDCNDNVFAINPGASEICDGLDNNCDGQIDEGLLGTDADGDGYYAIGSCGAVADDCNDNNAGINPGAVEIPYDGIDQDCSGADLTYVNGNACADCHVPDDALDSVHNYRPIATSSTCVLCHAGPVSSILSGHYGKTVRTTDNNVAAGSTINCWTCHDNNNHSGGPVAGAFGDGLGDVWNDVSPPYPANYTCDDCHASRAARHATATAHNNRVIDSTCANCHTSDTTVLGSPGTGSLASAADVDALHGVAQETDCALCHNYSGTLLDASVVRQTIQNGLSGTQVSCLDCHIDKGTNHGNFEHPIEVGPLDLSYNPGQLCSDCHVVANWTEIEGTEHNVATNGAGSCATCHSSPRQEVQDVIADAANNGGYPIRCLACHADKELTVHGNVDHVALDYVTGGTTFCLDCHDPGTAANSTVDVTHSGTCTLCHTTIPALQPGVPANGGDCVACHVPDINVNWEVIHLTNPPSHASLVQVATTSCNDCHDNTLVSAAVNTHNGCDSCHDADTGTLVAINDTNSQDFITGGDCTTCHGNDWGTVHTIAPDHSSLVTTSGTNSCASCHADALIDASTHLTDCSNCHSTTDGSLQSSAVGKDFIIGGNCETCHTTGFDSIHATSHTHTVAQGAGDLSFEAPGTPCSDCHVVATWTEIEGTEHNVATNGAGSCSTCHNSTRQEVMDAITAGADPTNCLVCHSNKELAVHGSIDHVASGDVTLATACADCHDPGTTANATVEITHGANCAFCHTTVPALREGVSPGPADCATCHSATWNVTHTAVTPDHSNLVKSTGTSCVSCHDNTLASAAPDTHLSDCSNCHSTTDGSLQSTAVGKDFTTGGDCTTCHGSTWNTLHTTAPDHSGIVTVASTSCASCHDNTLVSASAKTHNACTNCHNATTGELISLAINKSAPGDCTSCHTGSWNALHNGHSHTVELGSGDQSSGTSCGVCHVVATWGQINGTEHNVATNGPSSCETCHNSPRQEVIDAIALGVNPTNCLDCHSANAAAHGSVDHVATGYVTLISPCNDCHDPGSAENATVDITHSGNCNLCHTTIPNLQPGVPADGGTCATCHTGDVQTAHPDCTACHGEPPSGSTAPNRDRAHSEHDLLGYGSVTPSCNACHNSAAHYDGSTQVSIPSSFDDRDSGTPSFNGSTCSNTRCHGGQTTPSWSTGSLNVNTQCRSCHNDRERGSNQYNDYGQTGGEHDVHVRGVPMDCKVCHSTAKLAPGHFSNLQTTTFEQAAGTTIGGAGTYIPEGVWNDSENTCSNFTCHIGNDSEYHRSSDSWFRDGWHGY